LFPFFYGSNRSSHFSDLFSSVAALSAAECPSLNWVATLDKGEMTRNCRSPFDAPAPRCPPLPCQRTLTHVLHSFSGTKVGFPRWTLPKEKKSATVFRPKSATLPPPRLLVPPFPPFGEFSPPLAALILTRNSFLGMKCENVLFKAPAYPPTICLVLYIQARSSELPPQFVSVRGLFAPSPPARPSCKGTDGSLL